jgi:hypothetical protein
MIRWSLLSLGILALAMACSSGSSSGTGGGTGGTGTGGAGGGGAPAGPPLAYTPCDQARRVGGFSVELKRNEGSTPFTAVNGGVKNAVDPSAVWQQIDKDGDCRLLIGPNPCAMSCPNGKVCSGANTCVDEPLTQDTGMLTVSGLSAPVSLMWLTGQGYSTSLTMGYPPAAPEAQIALKTGGGTTSPISLAGRGIEPLEFAGTGLRVARNQPLAVNWTASPKSKSARIHIKLDIAHHGGISARIECDVADSGSASISATLVGKLMDRGVAGFPSINLTRQTIDSTTIPAGCVELAVASNEERLVDVEGVISCNTEEPTCPAEDKECKACPTGMSCGKDARCK